MQFVVNPNCWQSSRLWKTLRSVQPSSKTKKIMKLTGFFIISCFLHLSAKTSGQNVTLVVKDTRLEKVFKMINKQTGYTFLADADLLKSTTRVTLDLKDLPLEKALEICLKNQAVTFIITDQIISLAAKSAVLPAKKPETIEELTPPPAKISGRVTNEEGEPVFGVNVIVKGKSGGTTTDADGRFSITADTGDKLEFSMVGFKTITSTISGSNPSLLIKLEIAAQQGSEIVVVGFGTQKKINTTGAITQVKGQELENRVSPNLVSTLQGVVPNLNISVNNRGGEPGATPDFNIRGTGSLSGGSPFVLVDGVPQDMNSVNPYDVESISVLKDASASAIYGVRAAYGVILITTKKGSVNSKPKISYDGNAAWQTPTKLPTVASSVEWSEAINDGYTNAGLPLYFQLEDIEKMRQNIENPGSVPVIEPSPTDPGNWKFPTYANNDPYKEFYKSYAFNHQHNLNLSGGGKAFTYFISGGLQNQGPQYRFGNEHFDRYTVTANLKSEVTSWLRFFLNSKYTKRKTDMPHANPNIGDFYHDVPRRWPMYPVYDANGHFFINTFAMVENGGRNVTDENQILNSLGFEIEPVKNWKINADFNFRNNFTDIADQEKIVYMYGPDEVPKPDWTSTQNSITAGTGRSFFNSNNVYTTYQTNVSKHNFKIMAGFQTELNRESLITLYRPQLITDNVPFVTTATGQMNVTGYKRQWATLGYFGRFNYNYDEKYLFEFSSRYDGTSRFLKDRRWGFFPSFSAGYNIAREAYWSDLKDKISLLKLRVSYGSLGNQAVSLTDYFPYLPGLGINSNLAWIMGSTRPLYVTAPGLVSPDITWETATTFNVGLDAEALANRLSFSFDVYERKTDDMFGPAESLPAIVGATAPRRNNASLKTKGFELTLGWRDRVGNVSYNARLMLADNKSTVTKYRNVSGILSDHYVGKTLGEIWGYTTAGIYQTAEEVAAGPNQSFFNANWVPGDVQYVDLNKDGKINNGANTVNDHGDLSVIGNSTPRYSYGASIGAEWKGFYIDMLWQGVAKRDLFLTSNFFWGVTGDVNQATIFKEHLDYWRPDNTDAYYPRPIMTSESGKNRQTQTRFLQDASYFRLKNLQVGYTIPSAISDRIGLGLLRVYFTGENLITFTKLSNVFDPEATGGTYGAGKLYPLAKLYSLGINLKLK